MQTVLFIPLFLPWCKRLHPPHEPQNSFLDPEANPRPCSDFSFLCFTLQSPQLLGNPLWLWSHVLILLYSRNWNWSFCSGRCLWWSLFNRNRLQPEIFYPDVNIPQSLGAQFLRMLFQFTNRSKDIHSLVANNLFTSPLKPVGVALIIFSKHHQYSACMRPPVMKYIKHITLYWNSEQNKIKNKVQSKVEIV